MMSSNTVVYFEHLFQEVTKFIFYGGIWKQPSWSLTVRVHLDPPDL